MIITKKQLQGIIKEELQIVLEKCRKAKKGEVWHYRNAVDPGEAAKVNIKTGQIAEPHEVGIWVAQSPQGKMAVCQYTARDQRQAQNWAQCQNTTTCDVKPRLGTVGTTAATPYEKPDDFFAQLKPLLDQTFAAIKKSPGKATEIINVFKNSLYSKSGPKSLKGYVKEARIALKKRAAKQIKKSLKPGSTMRDSRGIWYGNREGEIRRYHTEREAEVWAQPQAQAQSTVSRGPKDSSAMVDRYAASRSTHQSQISAKIDQQIDVIKQAAELEQDDTIKNAYNDLLKALENFKTDLEDTAVASAKKRFKGVQFKQ
jgi:hypothetical protein